MTEPAPNEPAAERVRVAVVFGGRSSEHSISCVSAGSVLRALDRDRYDVVPVGITQDGRWVLAPDDPDRLAISDGRLPTVPSGSEVALSADPTAPGLQVRAAGDVPVELHAVDVVFPVLHGPWGEDGTIQGLLELAGVPYVGSGVFASAAAMDKGRMKALFAAAGLGQAPYVVITERDWTHDRAGALARVRELGRPRVRQAGTGRFQPGDQSGHRTARPAGGDRAARRHDPRVVVEAAVQDAREVECGVLTDADGRDGPSVCAEIVVREGHDFYDFAAKYLEDAADLVVPADLPPDVVGRVHEVARAASTRSAARVWRAATSSYDRTARC